MKTISITLASMTLLSLIGAGLVAFFNLGVVFIFMDPTLWDWLYIRAGAFLGAFVGLAMLPAIIEEIKK